VDVGVRDGTTGFVGKGVDVGEGVGEGVSVVSVGMNVGVAGGTGVSDAIGWVAMAAG
jgi:hypothetical protein